jgi:hypothetical protein
MDEWKRTFNPCPWNLWRFIEKKSNTVAAEQQQFSIQSVSIISETGFFYATSLYGTILF